VDLKNGDHQATRCAIESGRERRRQHVAFTDGSLIEACIEGRIDDVDAAIQAGASPNATYRGSTAIHWAVQYEQDAVVQYLLACGADPDHPDADDGGFRALHTAAGFGSVSIVRQLLIAGADPNSTARGNGNATPLHNAAAYGYLECVQLLAEHGAVIMARDADDHTPAHFAKENGHESIVEWLDSNS
jgi:ankyrin repeat protein